MLGNYFFFKYLCIFYVLMISLISFRFNSSPIIIIIKSFKFWPVSMLCRMYKNYLIINSFRLAYWTNDTRNQERSIHWMSRTYTLFSNQILCLLSVESRLLYYQLSFDGVRTMELFFHFFLNSSQSDENYKFYL